MIVDRLKLLIKYNVIYPLISVLPRAVSYKIASFKGLVDNRYDRIVVAASLKGLLSVFPRMDREEALEHIKVQHCMLSRELLDVYWLDRISETNISNFIHLNGLKYLENAKKTGRPIILYSAHFGRLIMPSMAIGALGTKTSCLFADISNPNIPAVERRFLVKKVRAMERLMGGEMIQKGESLRRLYDVLEAKGILIIIIDAPPEAEDSIKEFPFLGGYARLSTGIVKLAKRKDAILLPYFAVEERRGLTGNFLPSFSVTDCTEDEALRRIFQPVEEMIKKYPAQWWMWDKLSAIWHQNSSNL